MNDDKKPQTNSDLLTQEKVELKRPKMYMVLFHDDDYTSFEFVIAVLIIVFHKSPPQAQKITMEVHTKGIALVGIYTYEIATTGVRKVEQLAEKMGYPFRATMEEAFL